MYPQHMIYGLVDPRSLQIRYVGKSSSGIERPLDHLHPSSLRSSSLKNDWISELKHEGLVFEVTVLEEINTPKNQELNPLWTNARRKPTALNEAERWWIALGRAFGWNLLNQTDGGEGVAGFRRTEASKARCKTPWTAERRRAQGIQARNASASARARMSSGRTALEPHEPSQIVWLYRECLYTQQHIADYFGVPRKSISAIVLGLNFKHLTGVVGPQQRQRSRIAHGH